MQCLEKVVAPRCVTTGAGDGPDSANTVEVPQLMFIGSRRHSCWRRGKWSENAVR